MAAVKTKVTSPSTNASMRVRKLLRTVKGIPMGHLKSICRTSRAGQNRSETNFALPRRILATCITLASLAGSHSVEAADLSVMVVGRDGRGVDEVVVTAMPEGAGTESSPHPEAGHHGSEESRVPAARARSGDRHPCGVPKQRFGEPPGLFVLGRQAIPAAPLQG